MTQLTHTRTLAALLIPLFASIIPAHAETSPAALQKKLEAEVKRSGFKPDNLGLFVGANHEGALQSYFGVNAQSKMLPASLSKLITAGAALSRMHPGYKFRTQLIANSKTPSIKDGVLKGPVYLKGGGDPSFTSEKMWLLVNELSRTGVKSIEGDVVVDDTLFDSVRFDADRQDERVDRAYDAPVGAMSMNWNSVNVYFRPGSKVGEPLQVFPDVMSPYFKFRNETKTVANGKVKNVVVERTSEKGFKGDVLIARGSMGIDQPEAVIYKSITRPELWSGYNFIEFLRQRGISVSGEVKAGAAPADGAALAGVDSEPLGRIVTDMNKWSNNYVAEMLVKNLAAFEGDRPATMTKGMERVRDFMEKLGFKRADYEFINAAGFTRKNRFSAEQLGRYLEIIRSDFSTFPEYLASLPIAGVDGTLRNRMKDTKATKWVRAKTGLLNGTVGLAGYAGRANGEIVSFAFMYNGPGREDKARALFDRLAALIVEE